ncbi:phosphoglucosamine mutase [Candidatus Micrarchaeota archaeon]|nr:phosphoglucosamine mutase [Candidatus Micrarchaeota archaeon]
MLFGTNGIRGTFEELTPELALKASQGIGIYFKKGKIGIARDARLTGECLSNAVKSGLLSVGCEVVDFGVISSPTAEFMVKKLGLDGVIIVTASHNPPEWNGLKVVDGKGINISKERGGKIEELMDEIKTSKWDNVGTVEKYERAVDEHIEEMIKHLDVEKIRKAKLKVVLDCGNGTAVTVAPKLFKELGCEIVTLNSHMDGTFPGRPSEPSEENVKELIEMVKKEKADCGIAWDGDGDRVIYVDEKGGYVIGDKVFGISVIQKLNEKKGQIVTTVATSKLIEDLGNRFGIKTIYTKVGAPYLSEEMDKGGAVIGGEEVGGVIWPEISYAKDGMYTAAKMLELLSGEKLSEIVLGMPNYMQIKEKIRVDEKNKMKAIERVRKYAKGKGRIIDVDGIRVDFKDSWVIARPSGTEPYIRVFAEAKEKKKAEELVKEYSKIIKSSE